MSDESPKRMYSTVPPPEGAEDLYSASTVVGQASAELLALVRSATEEGDKKASGAQPPQGASQPPSRTPSQRPSQTDDEKLAAMKAAAARSAKEAAANEVAKEAAKAASTRPPQASTTSTPAGTAAGTTTPTASTGGKAFVAIAGSGKKAAAAAEEPKVPRLNSERPIEETSRRRAATPDPPRPAVERRAMPPVLAIALVFAAAALALAATVR